MALSALTAASALLIPFSAEAALADVPASSEVEHSVRMASEVVHTARAMGTLVDETFAIGDTAYGRIFVDDSGHWAIWIYRESNGQPGLQRGGDNPDQLIFFQYG